MKEHFSKEYQRSKKYQRAKLHFQNLRSKAIVRFWNLAKRLDQSHSKNEEKK